MARKPSVDKSLLEAALEGLELQKARIEDQIRNVRRMLGGKPGSAPAAIAPVATAAPASTSAAPRRRELSAAARERIAAAQKRRWAAFRKKSATKTAPAKTAASKGKEKKEG